MVSDYEVLKEEFVPLSKVKDVLKDVDEKNFEQKLAFEHAKKSSKLDSKKSEALMKKLMGLEMRKLKEEQAAEIVDLMPKDIEDLNVILAKSQIQFKEEEIQQILEIVKSV